MFIYFVSEERLSWFLHFKRDQQVVLAADLTTSLTMDGKNREDERSQVLSINMY